MSRFILVLELVLGSIALALRLSGGSVFFMLAFTPFLLVFLLPVFASLAVWPLRDLAAACKDAFPSDSATPVHEKNLRIWTFARKTALIGGAIGFLIGFAFVLSRLDTLNPKDAVNSLSHAGLSILYALVAAVVLNLVSELTLGRKTAPPAIGLQKLPPEELACKTGLSPRETEIVALIASGSTNREIARALFLSEDTIKNHITNIFRKTGVKNRGGLVGLLVRRPL